MDARPWLFSINISWVDINPSLIINVPWIEEGIFENFVSKKLIGLLIEDKSGNLSTNKDNKAAAKRSSSVEAKKIEPLICISPLRFLLKFELFFAIPDRLKIGEETLLHNTIKFLELYGIKEVVINVHYLGEQIIDYINKKKFNLSINIIKEKN